MAWTGTGTAITGASHDLTTLAKAKSHLGLNTDEPLIDGVSVKHTGDGTAATIEVTDAAIILIQTGGGGAGTDTLTFAANTTLGDMVTAINALARDYQAVMYGPTGGASNDLQITAQTSCLSSYVTIPYTNDWLIDNLIDQASAEIEMICNRYFNTASYAIWEDGSGSDELWLDHYPVTAVTRVSEGRLGVLGVRCAVTGATWASVRATATALILVHKTTAGSTTNTLSFATYTTIDTLRAAVDAVTGWSGLDMSYGSYLSAEVAQSPAQYCLLGYAYIEHPYQALEDYLYSEDSGRLSYSGGFPRGTQNIYIEYNGGYSTIPYEIEAVCLSLIDTMYGETTRDPALQSEKLGDYSWTAKSGGGSSARAGIAKRLEKYVRITF